MQDAFSPQPSEERPEGSSPSQQNQPYQTYGEATPHAPTPSSKEMPEWLRSEVEADRPRTIENVSATPDGTQKEVKQLRDDLTSTQHQMAGLQHQYLSIQERQSMTQQERGGCLTAWLVFISIANTLGIIFGFSLVSEIGPLGLVSVIGGALALIGVVGTWQMKKWGSYTLLVVYLLNVLVNIIVVATLPGSASAGPIIGALVGLGITSALLANKWYEFE